MEEPIPPVEERARLAKHKEDGYSPLTRRQLEAVRKHQPRGVAIGRAAGLQRQPRPA